MTSRYVANRIALFIAGAGVVGLSIAACNKQPNPAGNGAATEAPPISALPLAAAAVTPAPPAPLASALPPPSRPIAYASAPPSQRYRYIDHAYSMGDAFAQTPPDYTVDYQGTRPWIWRARNGAYRIVERLPRGERIYYYDSGRDQPFLVRDPDYSYAYDGGQLVGVYGPDGAELGSAMAARRADEAAQYYDRSRELYRAAQYQRRQAAYANEWAGRRDDLRNDHRMWQEQQTRNSDWRSWHDAHQSQESAQWGQERDQRMAYASAIGIPASSSGPMPNPDELARRQAAYLASRNAAHGATPAPATVPSATSSATLAQDHSRAAPPIVKGPPVPALPAGTAQDAQAAAQAKSLQAEQAAAAAAKQKEAAAAQAKAAQAAQAEQAAAEQKKREAAAAQASAAQEAHAQKALEQAKQNEATAAKTKAVQAAAAQKAAAEARQKDAAAAQAKVEQAAQAEKAAAEAKQKEAAAAKAKAAQGAQAQHAADDAQRKEAAAHEAKVAQAAAAQKANLEAKQHEAAAAQAKKEQAAQSSAAGPQAPKSGAAAAKDAPNDSKGKHEGKKEHQGSQQQQ